MNRNNISPVQSTNFIPSGQTRLCHNNKIINSILIINILQKLKSKQCNNIFLNFKSLAFQGEGRGLAAGLANEGK